MLPPPPNAVGSPAMRKNKDDGEGREGENGEERELETCLGKRRTMASSRCCRRPPSLTGHGGETMESMEDKNGEGRERGVGGLGFREGSGWCYMCIHI